ncbi:hypothetical protein OS493_004460 [Desmophyllum pertusum]|uniref:Uncharacterized protein n=1 Tax=Desmophyllum pertusum TaxID=174260 RepID=A0A9X0CYR5_9CNID|nr:hypothetical protein OS493_004460 [Desmophyllum pertusum]
MTDSTRKHIRRRLESELGDSVDIFQNDKGKLVMVPESMEENDTALCLQKLAVGLNQRVVLPASIKPHVFNNLAWDNIDRLEETLTGNGTSHRVNGIAVQAKVYAPDLPRGELPRVEKTKAENPRH